VSGRCSTARAFLLVSEIAEASRTPMEKVEVQVDEALAVSLKGKTDH
jgi:hypothetical protein